MLSQIRPFVSSQLESTKQMMLLRHKHFGKLAPVAECAFVFERGQHLQ